MSKTIPQIGNLKQLPTATALFEVGDDTNPSSTALIASFGQKVATIADLAALPCTGVANGLLVYVMAFSTAGDGGEGPFRYNSAGAATPVAGMIVNAIGVGQWERVYSGAVNVRWTGATGGGSADDYAAIAAALSLSKDIYMPSGIYKTSETIAVTSYTHVFGDGRENTVISPVTGVAGFTVTGTKVKWSIKNLSIDYGPTNGNFKQSNSGSVGVKVVTSGGNYPFFFLLEDLEVIRAYQGVIVGDLSFMYMMTRVYCGTCYAEGLKIDAPSAGTTVSLTNVYCNDTAGLYIKGINTLSINSCACDNSTGVTNSGVVYLDSCQGSINGLDAEGNTTISGSGAVLLISGGTLTINNFLTYSNTVVGSGGEAYCVRVSDSAKVNFNSSQWGGVRSDVRSGTGTFYATIVTSDSVGVFSGTVYSLLGGSGGSNSLDNAFAGSFVVIDKTITTTAFSFLLSGASLTSGSGAPASSPPDGSVYLRTDGTASTTLYVRAASSWSAIA